MTLRTVRVQDWCYRLIDEVFPAERNGHGKPSAHDFLLHDVAPALDLLAEDLEAVTVPASPGSSIRVYTGSGLLVQRFALFARLTDDDIVEVIEVQLDTYD